jgi:hypothetical protein
MHERDQVSAREAQHRQMLVEMGVPVTTNDQVGEVRRRQRPRRV